VRAARLSRAADDFEAPALALARWLEHAPAEHGPLLAEAALGQRVRGVWRSTAVQPCSTCGFPPQVRTFEDAISSSLLLRAARHHPLDRMVSPATDEEDSYDDT
jgi:hypothetical protein